MRTSLKFLLVDDDPISNLICSSVISGSYKDAHITVFEKPLEALKFIDDNVNELVPRTILLLDINMPLLNAWDFLSELKKREHFDIIKTLDIYIVSSSVDARDKERARVDPHVKDFITKPISQEVLSSFLTALKSFS